MKINPKTILSTAILAAPTVALGAGCDYDPATGEIKACGTRGLSSVSTIILNVTDWILTFGGAIAVLFIIFGGFQYLTAAGNEKQAETAKKTLTYAIIGLIVILLSKVIVLLVTNSINGISNI